MDGSGGSPANSRRFAVRAVFWSALLLVFVIVGVSASHAQRWGRYRMPPKFPKPGVSHRAFTFCRVLYESVRYEYLGQGWFTDYPTSDINLMVRSSELTKTPIGRDRYGEADHVVVRLTDDELFDYPFIFMSDVGTTWFGEDDVERLRAYLLKGGFLWVDDFWGPRAWDYWVREISKVLPPADYPIFDVPLDHAIFRTLMKVTEVPQVPSIQYWRQSGGGTSERGYASAQPHFRGIADENGRLMVIMTHNTDIADGWEREGEDEEFFHRFSLDSYAVGINVVLYAMTH